jgi:short subunit dehydrogenase-like uncharacterized protein
MSRGTTKTMIEGVARGAFVRRDGKLVALNHPSEGLCDFGKGLKPTIAMSWGDVSTAWYSTHIPNIEVHFEINPQLTAMLRIPSFVKSFMGLGFMQRILKAQANRRPEGPTEEERKSGSVALIGVGKNATGKSVRTRLRTMNGYTLTGLTSLAVAKRVIMGEFKPGFQTPSLAFGADFIITFHGVEREDLTD